MIEQIIGKYMACNRRLVIPTLGAFLKKESEDELVFVEFLKKDDGVLTALLESEYSLSATEAQAVVEQYVLSAKQQLASKGEFIINKLGVMRVDANNLYQFDYNPSVRADARGADARGAADALRAQFTPESQPQVHPRLQPQVQPVSKPLSQPTMQPHGQVEPLQVQPSGPHVPQPQSTTTQPQSTTTQSLPTKERSNVDRHKVATRSQVDLSSPSTQQRSAQDDDLRGLRYQKPVSQPFAGSNQRRADKIMIIAIIAAMIAIGSMLYGVFADSGKDIKLHGGATEQVDHSVDSDESGANSTNQTTK